MTVTAAGQKSRFIVAVLVDAATNDYGKLGDAVRAARDALVKAGLPEDVPVQAAADAGYWSEADLVFAAQARNWADVLVADPAPENGQIKNCYGRDRFTILPDQTAICPAGTPMHGPYADANGRQKWVGVGCADCPQKPQCTPGRERALTVSMAAEAMRGRLAQPGARERYNRRISTVEPVFSEIEGERLREGVEGALGARVGDEARLRNPRQPHVRRHRP